MKRLFWILLVLALYLVALMGCGLENIGKRQCYDVAWMDCVFTVDDLTITSAGTDLGATVTLSNRGLIEGTVVVDGQQRTFSAFVSGICDTLRSNEQYAGNMDVHFSYDESIEVRRQDFYLFSGEASVVATGDSRGIFTLEATVEDIGGAEAPPSDDDAHDEGRAGEDDEGVTGDPDSVSAGNEAKVDDTRDISMTVHASLSHGTSQQCTGGD